MTLSIEQLEAQKAKYQAKLRQVEAKQRNLKRKADAHRKIVIGAIFLKELKQFDWLDLEDVEVITKIARHSADQLAKGFPSLHKEEQSTKPTHIRGSLDEILGDG